MHEEIVCSLSIKILDAATVFCMPSYKISACLWLAGEPADMGDAYNIAVQVCLKDSGAVYSNSACLV